MDYLSCDNCRRSSVEVLFGSEECIDLYRNWSKGAKFDRTNRQHYNSRCRECQEASGGYRERSRRQAEDDSDEYSDESSDDSSDSDSYESDSEDSKEDSKSEEDSESDSDESESNNSESECEVKAILDHIVDNGVRSFLVEWDDSSRTWEPEQSLANCQELLRDYLRVSGRKRASRVIYSDDESEDEEVIRHKRRRCFVSIGKVDRL